MKTIKIYAVLVMAVVISMASCKKDETIVKEYDVVHSTTDGQARIMGSVTYLNAVNGLFDAAPWAVIKIASDTTTKAFNQYWLAGPDGKYNVKGLGVGNYFVTAEYTDAFTGAVFTSGGSILLIKNSVDDITLDFQLH